MKSMWLAGGVLLFSTAIFAQAGLPLMNDGTASYGYTFDLPAARGRYQPTLGLSYNSEGETSNYGVGWSLNLSYIEQNSRASPAPDGGTRSASMNASYPTSEWWLTLNGAARVLVTDPAKASTGVDFRPDVDSGYTKIHRNGSSDTWAMVDGVGTVYTFAIPVASCAGCKRYYLATVVDVDGNTTQFHYQEESTGSPTALLKEILYNNQIIAIELRYQTMTYLQSEVLDGLLTTHALVLTSVSVDRFPSPNAYPSGGAALLTSYTLKYQPSAQTGRMVLQQVQQHETQTLLSGLGSGSGYQITDNGWDAGSPVDDGYVFSYSGLNDGGPDHWYSVKDYGDPPAKASWGDYTGYPQDSRLGSLQCDNLFGVSQDDLTYCVACAITDVAAFIDLDGDGLPDMVWGSQVPTPHCNSEPGQCNNPGCGNDDLPEQALGIWWARNLSVPGAGPGSVSFVPTGVSFAPPSQLIQQGGTLWPGVISASNAGGPITQLSGTAVTNTFSNQLSSYTSTQLIDMNGDGRPDLVEISAAGVSVRYNQINTTGGFDAPVVNSCAGANCGSCLGAACVLFGNTLTAYASLMDVNGDGIPDYVVSNPIMNAATPQWSYYLGYLDNALHWQMTQNELTLWSNDSSGLIVNTSSAGSLSPLAQTGPNSSYGLPLQLFADLNGDGYPDILEETVQSCGAGFGAMCGRTSVQYMSPLASAQYQWSGYLPAAVYWADPYSSGYAQILKDVNGDGRPDVVWLGGYSPNFGSGYFDNVIGASIPTPFSTINIVNRSDSYEYDLAGTNQQLLDIDGDGILDFVFKSENSGSYPLQIGLQATSDGTPKADLLINIITPGHESLAISYGPSLAFGAVSGVRPHAVVTSTTTTTPRANGGNSASLSRTVQRWYAYPSAAPAWDDPSRMEQLGFASTWTFDDASQMVSADTWGSSHQLKNLRLTHKMGRYAGMAPRTPGSFYLVPNTPTTIFDSTTTFYDSCRINPSSAYPSLSLLLGVDHFVNEEGASPLESMSYGTLSATHGVSPNTGLWLVANGGPTYPTCDSIDISGLDSAGNAKQVTYVRDTNDLNGAVTVQFNYPSLASAQAVCKSCVLKSYASSPSWPNGDLFRKRYHYDAPLGGAGGAPDVTSGHLNYVEELVSGTGEDGEFERSPFVAYNSNGLVASVTRYLSSSTVSSVTTTYKYDDQTGMQLIQKSVSDTGAAHTAYSLFTRFVYDATTGVVSQVVGPFTSTAPPTSVPGGGFPIVSFVYDNYLRRVGEYESESFTSPSYWLSQAGYQSATATSLAWNWAVSFASSGHLTGSVATVGALSPPPLSDDMVYSKSFFDGAGRMLQARTLQGTGGSGAADSHVSEGLASNLFRVQAGVYNSAGLATVSYDPYYSTSDSFEDVSSSPPSANGQTAPLFATTFTYDTHWRVACQAHQKAASLSPYACTSDNGVLATVTTYSIGAPPNLGRAFLAVTSKSDSQNVLPNAGGTTTRYFDASGALVYSQDAESNLIALSRDPLGRVVATTRMAGAAGQIASSITYDKKGRVTAAQDASSGNKVYTYAPTGELTSLGSAPTSLNPNGTVGVNFIYGTFGRLLQKVPFAWLASANSTGCGETWHSGSTTPPTSYHYDIPDPASSGVALPGTNYTAGRLSWAANGVSAVALSYDVFGNVTQRAESFTNWNSTSWSTANRTYRPDGAVTSTTIASPAALLPPFAYNTFYDSQGHTSEVENGVDTVFWATSPSAVAQPQHGSVSPPAYDALGRLGVFGDGTGQSEKGYWFDKGPSATQFAGAAHFSFDLDSGLPNAYDSGLTSSPGIVNGNEMIAVTGMKYQGSKLQTYHDAVSGNSYMFSYDVSDRLQIADSNATGGSAGTDPNVWQGFSESTSFDISGSNSLWNIQSVNNLGAAETYSYAAQSANASSLDQLTSVAGYGVTLKSVQYEPPPGAGWPGRGLVTTYQDQSGATWSYQYDEEMRLTSISNGSGTQETISYGPLGELAVRAFPQGSATRAIGVQYRVGEDLSIYVVTASSSPTASVNVLSDGTRVATVTGASILYYHRDRLGSVIGTSLNGGQPGAKYRYDPYGYEVDSNVTATNDSELGYTGELKLSGDLVYLHARVYSTTMRRFLQPDNVDEKRYTYAEGDPINHVDPSGHGCEDGSCPIEITASATNPPPNDPVQSGGFQIGGGGNSYGTSVYTGPKPYRNSEYDPQAGHHGSPAVRTAPHSEWADAVAQNISAFETAYRRGDGFTGVAGNFINGFLPGDSDRLLLELDVPALATGLRSLFIPSRSATIGQMVGVIKAQPKVSMRFAVNLANEAKLTQSETIELFNRLLAGSARKMGGVQNFIYGAKVILPIVGGPAKDVIWIAGDGAAAFGSAAIELSKTNGEYVFGVVGDILFP